MIVIKCSVCKGIKGYDLGDMRVKCPQCFGTGTETHDSVAAAVSNEVSSEVVKKARGRKPKVVYEPAAPVVEPDDSQGVELESDVESFDVVENVFVNSVAQEVSYGTGQT